MPENIQEEKSQLFPEDPDAPKVDEKKILLKEIYLKHQKPIDITVLILISILTVITVSLSVYIILEKYI
jgi:hypothetical protein